MSNDNKHIIPTELLIRYFANEATESERSEIEAWRNKKDIHKKEFEAFEKLWKLTGKVTGKEYIDIEYEWNKIHKIIDPKETRVVSIKRIVQIAASIVIITSLSILGIKQSQTTTQKSEIAQINDFLLPDGSQVKLNAESKISFIKGFGKEHRELSLKGEAYFKVKENKQLPFVITARNTKIEVVGTEFNVNAYKEEIEVKVVVTRGKVKFYNIKEPEKEIILSGGESGAFIKELMIIEKEPEQNLNDIAWVTRKIDFKNTTLTDAGKVLKNTYHKEFIIAPNIKDCTITVSFENVEFESVLKVLQSTLNLEITRKDNTIIISGNGC